MRPSVSAVMLVVVFGAGGLIPNWPAIAQTRLSNAFYASLPKAFEVASIKPSKPGGRAGGALWGRDGRFSASNSTLERLILLAYGIRRDQLEGLPSRVGSRSYTIQAEAPPGFAKDIAIAGKLAPNERRQAMLAIGQTWRRMMQSLLADRFGMRAHWITKGLPVYELVVAKGGPKLTPANAADAIAAHHKPGIGWFSVTNGKATTFDLSTSMLAMYLSELLDRNVIDRTSITGRYDFKMKWDTLGESLGPTGVPSASGMAPRPTVAGVSIFTAIKRQLGLRLTPAKQPEDVLAVDHIEPLMPN